MRLHAELESIFDKIFQKLGFLGERKYVPGIPVLSGGDPYPDWLWHYPAWIVNWSGKLRHAFTYTLLMHPLSGHQFKQTTTSWKCEDSQFLFQLVVNTSLKQINSWASITIHFSSVALILPVPIGFFLVNTFSCSIAFDKIWFCLDQILPEFQQNVQNCRRKHRLSRILNNNSPLRLVISVISNGLAFTPFISGHSNRL